MIVGVTIAINVSLFIIKDIGDNENIFSKSSIQLVIIFISFLFGYIITLLILPRIIRK